MGNLCTNYLKLINNHKREKNHGFFQCMWIISIIQLLSLLIDNLFYFFIKKKKQYFGWIMHPCTNQTKGNFMLILHQICNEYILLLRVYSTMINEWFHDVPQIKLNNSST